jgi:hypothetical protein
MTNKKKIGKWLKKHETEVEVGTTIAGMSGITGLGAITGNIPVLIMGATPLGILASITIADITKEEIQKIKHALGAEIEKIKKGRKLKEVV